MGLGFIALGLLLYDGVRLGINGVSLFPSYIGLSILLIGLLSVRKRIIVKQLDVSLILGALLLILNVVELDNNLLKILYDIMHLSFIILILWGVTKLSNDEKFKNRIIKYYVFKILIYVAIRINPLLIPNVDFMIKWNTFLMFMIEILTIIISFKVTKRHVKTLGHFPAACGVVPSVI